MSMERKRFRQTVLPLITAFIWGLAFVAQSVGAEYIGPLTFNALRGIIGCAAVLLFFPLVRKLTGTEHESVGKKKDLIAGGTLCGLALTAAAFLQQAAMKESSVGKAGFITALYIVLVPVFLRLFFQRRVSRLVWLGVLLAVLGLYFLCMKPGGFAVERGDVLLFFCACCFSLQIICVDHFAQNVNGLLLSAVQFFTLAVVSGTFMLIFESPSFEAIYAARWALLYVGVLSTGVAYTLQVLAQQGTDPTIVSLLMSMESVFATLSGAMILGDRLSRREYLGCALMLAAVILAQLPENAGEKFFSGKRKKMS